MQEIYWCPYLKMSCMGLKIGHQGSSPDFGHQVEKHYCAVMVFVIVTLDSTSFICYESYICNTCNLYL